MAADRERDEGHEGDATNPVSDAKHMPSAET